MRGDNFVALVTVIAICLIIPYGCMPKQTQEFLTNHSYLSSWAQAVGSLMAIWATFAIFKLQSIDSQKNRDLEKDKASIKGESHLLKEKELRSTFNKLKAFSERCKKAKNNLDEYIYSIFVADEFLSLQIQGLDKKDFDILVDAFGKDIVSLQRAIIKLDAYSSFVLVETSEIDEKVEKGVSEDEIIEMKNKISSKISLISEEIRCIEMVCNVLYDKYRLFG